MFSFSTIHNFLKLLLNSDETEYFMLLVHQNRAGTKSLKEFYNQQIMRLEEQLKNLKNSLKSSSHISQEYEAKYYSDWLKSAIHILISIPEFQNREALAKHLRLPIERIDETLSFLQKVGLCEKFGQTFKITSKALHLDKTSAFINQHHINWRLQAINHIQNKNSENYHYSAIISFSKSDFDEIKMIMNECAKKILSIVQKSDEEHLGQTIQDTNEKIELF